MRYLYTKHPDVAEGFGKETSSFSDLPERVKQLKAIKKRINKKK